MIRVQRCDACSSLTLPLPLALPIAQAMGAGAITEPPGAGVPRAPGPALAGAVSCGRTARRSPRPGKGAELPGTRHKPQTANPIGHMSGCRTTYVLPSAWPGAAPRVGPAGSAASPARVLVCSLTNPASRQGGCSRSVGSRAWVLGLPDTWIPERASD